GIRPQRLLDLRQIGGVNVCGAYSKAREVFLHQSPAGTIDRSCAHDVCAGLKQGQIYGANRTHARTGSDATAAVLQLGDVVFKSGDGGIPDTRIDVAFFLAGKQRRAMRSITKGERGRLVDGNIDRTSCVRLVSRANQFAVNTQMFRVHEISFWLPGRGRIDASSRHYRSRANVSVSRPSPSQTVI